MSDAQHNVRAAGCLNALAIDEWLAGDDDAELHGLRTAHLEQCADCRVRVGAVGQHAQAFLLSAPSLGALGAEISRNPVPPRTTQAIPARRVIAFASGTMAIAIAAAALLILKPQAQEEGTRTKGAGPQLGLYIKRNGVVVPGADGAVVHPGDVLRFTYSSPRDGFLAVWGDDDRELSVYHPERGETAVAAPRGRDVALDFAVELDGRLGRERFFGVFCDRPMGFMAMMAPLSRPAPSAPPYCALHVLTLRKEALP